MSSRRSKPVSLIPALAMMLVVLNHPALQLASGNEYGTAQSAEQTDSGFQTITSEQLNQRLPKKDFLLVNVHIPYEGQINATDVFIPYDKIDQNLDKLPSDKGAKIVLYCRSGHMSEIAAKQLSELGYTQVSHLSGGMIAWTAAGYRLLEQ